MYHIYKVLIYICLFLILTVLYVLFFLCSSVFFSLNEYFWSEIFLISLITFFTIVFRVLFLVADLRLTINILTSGYMHAKPLQSCLSLRSPIDHSPPGSSVHGDSPGKISGMGCHVLPQGIFWPEIEPVSLNVFYRSPHPV